MVTMNKIIIEYQSIFFMDNNIRDLFMNYDIWDCIDQSTSIIQSNQTKKRNSHVFYHYYKDQGVEINKMIY